VGAPLSRTPVLGGLGERKNVSAVGGLKNRGREKGTTSSKGWGRGRGDLPRSQTVGNREGGVHLGVHKERGGDLVSFTCRKKDRGPSPGEGSYPGGNDSAKQSDRRWPYRKVWTKRKKRMLKKKGK